MEWSEQTAFDRAKAGDADAWRTLVERHSRVLFRLAYRITASEEDAEDVVQESLLRAWKQIARYDGRAAFGTWLHRIAINCSLDLVRTRRRRNEVAALEDQAEDLWAHVPAGDPGPDRLALSGEVRERVASAFSQLSVSERTAFVLRHFEGMGIDDVSRVLGCQPNAAKHSVFRAVQKLRRALEPLMSAAR
jgi:RNA polymerase sigma-70 factor (ECF subfamily)